MVKTLQEMKAISDRHEPVVGVVALLPMFPDRDTIVGDLPSESVTTPSHVPNVKLDSHHTPTSEGEGRLCKCCRGLAVSSPCERF